MNKALVAICIVAFCMSLSECKPARRQRWQSRNLAAADSGSFTVQVPPPPPPPRPSAQDSAEVCTKFGIAPNTEGELEILCFSAEVNSNPNRPIPPAIFVPYRPVDAQADVPPVQVQVPEPYFKPVPMVFLPPQRPDPSYKEDQPQPQSQPQLDLGIYPRCNYGWEEYLGVRVCKSPAPVPLPQYGDIVYPVNGTLQPPKPQSQLDLGTYPNCRYGRDDSLYACKPPVNPQGEEKPNPVPPVVIFAPVPQSQLDLGTYPNCRYGRDDNLYVCIIPPKANSQIDLQADPVCPFGWEWSKELPGVKVCKISVNAQGEEKPVKVPVPPVFAPVPQIYLPPEVPDQHKPNPQPQLDLGTYPNCRYGRDDNLYVCKQASAQDSFEPIPVPPRKPNSQVLLQADPVCPFGWEWSNGVKVCRLPVSPQDEEKPKPIFAPVPSPQYGDIVYPVNGTSRPQAQLDLGTYPNCRYGWEEYLGVRVCKSPVNAQDQEKPNPVIFVPVPQSQLDLGTYPNCRYGRDDNLYICKSPVNAQDQEKPNPVPPTFPQNVVQPVPVVDCSNGFEIDFSVSPVELVCKKPVSVPVVVPAVPECSSFYVDSQVVPPELKCVQKDVAKTLKRRIQQQQRRVSGRKSTSRRWL